MVDRPDAVCPPDHPAQHRHHPGSHHHPHRARPGTPRWLTTAALALAFTAAGCGAGAGDPGAPTSPGSPPPSLSAGSPSATASGPGDAEADNPARLVLTPAADPTTAQTITWSQPQTSPPPTVSYQAAGQPTRTISAHRRPATSVRYSGTAVPRFTATLTGLRPATTYTYRISSGGHDSASGTFTTPAARMPTAGWTFLAFGDTQVDNATTVRRIIATARAAAPDAALAVEVGDIVNDPTTDREWADMFTAFADLPFSHNLLVSIGNHEQCILVDCSAHHAEAFRSYFIWPDNQFPGQRPTWFSVDYQGVRFIVLDPFGGHVDTQAAFLADRLTTNPNPWTIVVAHAPVYANRPGRTNKAIRTAWAPILEQHHADLVLTGHDHSYARGYRSRNGPTYVVSVSGPKFYDTTITDWATHGAHRVISAGHTATYQIVTATPTTLTYRAVVATTEAASPPGLHPGDTLDEFTITRTSDGSKTSTGSRPAPTPSPTSERVD